MRKLVLLILLYPTYVYGADNVLTRMGQASQCFWDEQNTRLGVNTNSPDTRFHVVDGSGLAQQTWSYAEGSVESTWYTDALGITTLATSGDSFIFPQGSVSNPGIALGDGDSGFYESSDDFIRLVLAGIAQYYWTSTGMSSANVNGFSIRNTTATATVPTFTVGTADLDTGIGSAGADQLSFIAGGVEGIRVTEDTNKLIVSTKGAIERNITVVNAATYDTLETDHILHVTYTGTGAVTNLRLMTASCTDGRELIIKDAGGNATTNNITITTEGAQTIDGAASLVINSNYDSISLYCESSNWFIM